MRKRRIRHLPVVDRAGRIAGLVTHRDLLAAASSSLTHRTEAQRLHLLAGGRAGEVMETHLSVTTADEPAAAAGDRMMQHKIGCLPVIDAEARVVGIVTEEDFVRWATARMSTPVAPASA
jgi:CBS domain-containing membrane protein